MDQANFDSNPCAEKMAFDSESEAQTAATVAAYQRGIKLKTYKCTKCDLWHNSSRY